MVRPHPAPSAAGADRPFRSNDVGEIATAIVLAAGEGSRLQSREPLKPLCCVAGTPLIDHALAGLARIGIVRAIVVTGYRAEAVEAHLAGRTAAPEVEIVRTPDWHLPNGVSAGAAAPLLGEAPALLLMADHLVDPRLYACVRDAGCGHGLRLGIDRRLGNPWVDPEDVTCVRTEGTSIVAIGKGLAPHDAYDTGVFAIGPAFLELLCGLETPSLTQAVQLMARRGLAEIVDCGGLDWIDVDDPGALAKAEQAFRDGRFGPLARGGAR